MYKNYESLCLGLILNLQIGKYNRTLQQSTVTVYLRGVAIFVMFLRCRLVLLKIAEIV